MEIDAEQPFSRATGSSSSCTSTGRDSGAGPVFVAVGRDKKVKESKSTLIWALRNMRPSKIVLVHVHCPARTIPMPLGGRFEANHLSKEELRAFRLEEKMKMNATLDTYLVICKAYKVQTEILIEEADDTATGLLNLISHNGITRLVMGASTFSRTKKTPKSKIAGAIFQRAVPACNIWFVSKGDLISTRRDWQQILICLINCIMQ